MFVKFEGMKLQHKLYLLILPQVMMLFLVYAYSSAVLEKEMLQKLTEHNSQLNYQNASSLKTALSEMKSLCSTTLSLENSTVTREIELVFRQLNHFQNINLSFRNSSKLWFGYMRDRDYIRRVSMCSKEGPTVYMQPSSDVFFITMTEPSEDWMVETMNRRGSYYMLDLDGQFRLCRAVINPSKYEKLGVITIDADFSFIMDSFVSQKMFSNQQYGLFVNGILASGDITKGIDEVQELINTPTPYDSILIDRAGGMVYLYYRLAGTEEIISFTQIPYDQIFGQTISQNLGIIIAFVLYVALVLLLVSLIVRNIIQSLRAFEGAFSEIEHGRFGVTVEAQVEGELKGFLESFNRMSVRLDELIHEVYEKDLTEHKLELQMLRNQINPHFFYNTLETLRMNCMLGREQQNIRMIEYLSVILRYGVSSGVEPVRLRDEIRHLEYYVQLHNLRTEARIDLRVFVPPELLDEETIKLMFQPLVENAIAHGLPADFVPLEICVLGYREAGNIVFTVTDNGVGMDAQTVQQITACLNGSAPEIKIGIGIKNVHRRIQLFYGDAYGLTLKSSPGHGTEVRIVVPHRGGIDS